MSTQEISSDMDGGQAYEFAIGDELRGERATKGKTLLDVQRDLRIQAAYISAIEDGDIAAFPNPSFIPGYIRSYSRYLSLDPDMVYRRFCAEHGFTGGKKDTQPVADSKPASGSRKKAAEPIPSFQPRFPLAEQKRSAFADIQASAIGSLLVLIALVGALGYGGWAVLQNIQRVQFAPVEEVPMAVAEVTPLETPGETEEGLEPTLVDLASPVTTTNLADLYRRQELEVPLIARRDGPIAAINPDAIAPLKMRVTPQPAVQQVTEAPSTEAVSPAVIVAKLLEEEKAAATAPVDAVATAAPVRVTVIAERAAWVRVYLENGTVIFEQILEKGESYTPPEGVGAPLIWAGNSGSVYVRLGDELHGPLGLGTRAVRDVALDPVSISETYPALEQIPGVLSQAMRTLPDGTTIQ
ncbi:RodZ domain-containing protein [Amaricoccus tamworthensis]|uniref:helix-turn-helix domain-containing protein n=1 Tax=Amaricoccus tamworthensis TaxID=57002 RepID=UPI003C7D6021